ncbi:MAG: tRNA (guanosine(46)-N7)-methyltransferase TrmB [Labilibaculum antarcticum]|uniref:tRNA (guanine-N(7)-)-methyltransferase n=1 Tax=Labilibaculum antarcticum TaxID=1717717 RepID=A0A1Y1CJ09_9BACT|nr:tRNA (guanosine(46)-N7)-methyltransferase TrmB [Labilibaculum antarcticum]BAX80315.1 tRNA (guanine(46)-N(7))-methyltransferase [Labilibaculum antarcticum]
MKNKLERFAEMKSFDNVFEPTHSEVWKTNYQYKGKWNKDVFKNSNPIVLEVGCGKGEYTVGLAKQFPNKNFIGIDIKGARIYCGAKEALDNGLGNVAFIRNYAELLQSIFEEGEIAEIWITFPDPQMKKTRKRLTGTRFLKLYSELLSIDGIIHLKSDSNFLYEYTKYVIKENNLKVIVDTDDLYTSGKADEILSIRTFYEQQFLNRGIPIKYHKFMLEGKTEFVEPDVEIELDWYRSYGRVKKE